MTEQEYNLALTTALLSNLMIRLEDLVEQGALRHEPKRLANECVRGIDRFTGLLLKNLDKETLKELDNINEAFNQFVKYEENETTISE